MKKFSFVLAAAGLMSLAACDKPTATENVAENAAEALENAADATSRPKPHSRMPRTTLKPLPTTSPPTRCDALRHPSWMANAAKERRVLPTGERPFSFLE
jgi:glucose/arabinose dehydrogenase